MRKYGEAIEVHQGFNCIKSKVLSQLGVPLKKIERSGTKLKMSKNPYLNPKRRRFT